MWCLQKRQQEFVNYKDYVGMDITSLVTLPVWIMEPYTMLQKVAEIMEYTDLLDKAATTADEYERCHFILLSLNRTITLRLHSGSFIWHGVLLTVLIL